MVEKYADGALHHPNLHAILPAQEVQSLLVTGTVRHLCVAETARTAFQQRKTHMTWVVLLLWLFGRVLVAHAGQVEVVMTEFTLRGDTWHVSTTLRHDDTGWEHYADAWRVVAETGAVLGTRVLYHPHEDEQPFTRSLSGLVIPAAQQVVYIEAHDKVHGWSPQRLRVDLRDSAGERFRVNR